MAEDWTIGRLLQWTADYLKQHGAENPRLEAEVLLAHARGCKRVELYTSFGDLADDALRTKFRELVKRRAEGVPFAYLAGKREFYSLDFRVTPDVLIPRPETEHLVEAALEFAKQRGLKSARIVDLGCGSGCIGLSLLKNLPEARLLAVDRSPAALSFARKNAEALGVSDRVTFFEGDVSAQAARDAALAVSGFEKFDLLLANPPYIAPNDPQIQSVRVGQYQPHVVRMVFDLKGSVKPQVFTLPPVGTYKYRLVFDLYPAVAPDPLTDLIAQTERKEQALNDSARAQQMQPPTALAGPAAAM